MPRNLTENTGFFVFSCSNSRAQNSYVGYSVKVMSDGEAGWFESSHFVWNLWLYAPVGLQPWATEEAILQSQNVWLESWSVDAKAWLPSLSWQTSEASISEGLDRAHFRWLVGLAECHSDQRGATFGERRQGDKRLESDEQTAAEN